MIMQLRYSSSDNCYPINNWIINETTDKTENLLKKGYDKFNQISVYATPGTKLFFKEDSNKYIQINNMGVYQLNVSADQAFKYLAIDKNSLDLVSAVEGNIIIIDIAYTGGIE